MSKRRYSIGDHFHGNISIRPIYSVPNRHDSEASSQLLRARGEDGDFSRTDRYVPMKMVAYGIYRLLLTFTPPYYPSKCSESHAEYAPLPRIVYFVGKWAISGHPYYAI